MWGGVRIRGGVGRLGSDFNEGMHNRAGVQISAQHRQFLKAEEFQRNSVILTGKHNKEYRLHVARQFCML